MLKLVFAALLIGGAIYNFVAYPKTTVMIVFNSLWLVIGLYLAYSWWSTPTYTPPPSTGMLGGRRRRWY